MVAVLSDSIDETSWLSDASHAGYILYRKSWHLKTIIFKFKGHLKNHCTNTRLVCSHLNGSQLAKMKKKKILSLHVPAIKLKTVGLKRSNFTSKNTIFVKMWNLEQFCENFIFVSNCLIIDQI